MKRYQRVFLLLSFILFLTVLLSPWMAWSWSLIVESHPRLEPFLYSFSRVFNRTFYILAIAFFLIFRSRLRLGSPSQWCLKPPRWHYRDFLAGFFLSLASMGALVIAMSLSDVFTPYFRLGLSTAIERCVKALIAALSAGALEEIMFRGIVFKGILEERRPVAAFVAANLLYAAVHFIKPHEKIVLAELDPRAGIVHLVYSFQTFLDLPNLFPGLLGLFLIGLVLSYAFLRTGSLYLSIGLHAGWIFGLKTMRIYGDFSREDLGWLFGVSEPKIVSGVFSWIGILAVGVIVHFLTRGSPNRLYPSSATPKTSQEK